MYLILNILCILSEDLIINIFSDIEIIKISLRINNYLNKLIMPIFYNIFKETPISAKEIYNEIRENGSITMMSLPIDGEKGMLIGSFDEPLFIIGNYKLFDDNYITATDGFDYRYNIKDDSMYMYIQKSVEET